MKNIIKKKIGIILIILIINISIIFAISGTRSLTSGMQGYGYMCEEGQYQIVMDPTAGYSMEEILSIESGWTFASLESDAGEDCTIQSDTSRVRCGCMGCSQTRTLIFNVWNAQGTFNNVFSNDQDGDTAFGLNSVDVMPDECSPDIDNDGYYDETQTPNNVCGCVISAKQDCDDTDQNINPGATDIPGNGIDEDCDGADTLLPSTISRILPDTVTQGVEFEVILDVQYTGGEPSFVVDERFDPTYFSCASVPSNNGQCNIVDNIGKVRWVITNPSSMQLKYYLIPKIIDPEPTCYDFSDVQGISGTYLFETRTEQEISGDYVIGDMSCVDCIYSDEGLGLGVEVCGNDVDEDCDGNICPETPPEVVEFSCSVKQSCVADELDVMHMSDTANAHAELYTQFNYNYKVCCSPKDKLSNDCGEVLLRLSHETDAHAEKTTYTPAQYTQNVCLFITTGILTCGYVTASDYSTAGYQTCTGAGYDACLLTLSTEFAPDTDMHVADCNPANAYITSLCCVTTAVEICTDGFDNDGDGLADCADPDCEGKTCALNKICFFGGCITPP